MTRFTKSAAVACGLFAACAVAITPAPANASDAQFPGTSGQLNMWEDDNYNGHCEGRSSYDTNFSNDSFNDQLSSFVNKTGNWWVLCVDDNYGGDSVCVRPHSHDGNIGNDTTYEDDITSVREFGTAKPGGCEDTTGTAN